VKVRFRLAAGALYLILVGAMPVSGHDEPPKTVREKTDADTARLKKGFLGVKLQDIRLVKVGATSKALDSSLWIRNRYDTRGNLVEQNVYDSAADTRSVSVFDDNNTWLEELTFGADSLEDRTVFIYNADGLISRVVSYNNGGDITGRLDYRYSDKSQTISAEKHGHLDSLEYTIVYTYEPGSDFTQLVEAVQTNADGTLRVKVQNHFERDRRARKSVFASDGKLSHVFSYTYTSGGDFHEIVKTMADGQVTLRQLYEYTQEGLVAGISETDGSGAPIRTLRYTYELFGKER
jgi:hypothetical protein